MTPIVTVLRRAALASARKVEAFAWHGASNWRGMTKTRPASAIEPKPEAGFFFGTIGFDLYLAALGVPRAAVQAPRVPAL